MPSKTIAERGNVHSPLNDDTSAIKGATEIEIFVPNKRPTCTVTKPFRSDIHFGSYLVF